MDTDRKDETKKLADQEVEKVTGGWFDPKPLRPPGPPGGRERRPVIMSDKPSGTDNKD